MCQTFISHNKAPSHPSWFLCCSQKSKKTHRVANNKTAAGFPRRFLFVTALRPLRRSCPEIGGLSPLARSIFPVLFFSFFPDGETVLSVQDRIMPILHFPGSAKGRSLIKQKAPSIPPGAFFICRPSAHLKEMRIGEHPRLRGEYR